MEAVDHNINNVKKKREFYRFGGRLGTIVEWCRRGVVYTIDELLVLYTRSYSASRNYVNKESGYRKTLLSLMTRGKRSG